MKFVLSLKETKHLQFVRHLPIEDVVLKTCAFSKRGKISDEEIESCIKKLRKGNKYIILDWDISCNTGVIERLEERINGIGRHVDAVRFRDPGVGGWLSKKFPEIRLQLSLENYSFNLKSIQRWIELFSKQIDRIILSNQIPLSEICKWRQALKTDIEIQGFGPIEGFYSARPLLNDPPTKDCVSAATILTGKDRIQNKMSALQSRHGTIFSFEDYLFLLDELPVIEAAGIDYVRLEIDESSHYQVLKRYYHTEEWIHVLKTRIKGEFTKGFFVENNTDKYFGNLTNRHLKKDQIDDTGIVIESVKGKYILMETNQKLSLPVDFLFVTPIGKEITFSLTQMKSLNGDIFTLEVPAGYYLLPWIKHISPSSIVQIHPPML